MKQSKIIFFKLIAIILQMLTIHLAHADSVAQINTEAFFENPAVSGAKVSPDGKFLGTLITYKNGRSVLVVTEIETKKSKLLAGFSAVDVENFYWVNDERLVFDTGDQKLAYGEAEYYPGLYTVKRDGSGLQVLIGREFQPDWTTGTRIKNSVISADSYFYSVDPVDGSDSVFIVAPVRNVFGVIEVLNLSKLNTKSGSVEKIVRPGKSTAWWIDKSGVPRLYATSEKDTGRYFYRDDVNSEWLQLAEFNLILGNEYTPYEFGPDGTLYVVAHQQSDTSALYRFDIKNKKIDDQPVLAVKDFDFSGKLIFDYKQKKLLGIHFVNDKASTLWFDDGLKSIQKAIDAILPDTVNQILLGKNGVTQTLVVKVYSDVQPVAYLLFNTQTKKLEFFSASFPTINAEKMTAKKFVRYKARDGLDIPAYISLPKNSTGKNLPMIVLVHGGPSVRGENWSWNPEVQFLASRGYAVLQPEFRGSTGFGYHHFKAGWKQWGLAMQDDIADGAIWAIQQGIADPKRICIAGASYGGYAALMGLAKNPELFRCGINWVGVTDINLLFESSWNNDYSEVWQRYGLPVLVGDKIKDAEKLAATSPINNARLIAQPLLLAYGDKDKRVPIKHGEIFLKEVRKTNKNVEWIEYEDEAHGWASVKNRVDFWNKVDVFLKKNLLEQQ
jgi:dipeptidyl aminopeptidase/acylaminoacyl peptidase